MAGLDATFVRSTLAYGKPLNEAFGTADTMAPIKLTQELPPKSSPAATMRRSTVLPRETLVDSQRALVVAGGVASNRAIKSALEALCGEAGFRFVAPPLKLCTDNAAMIAWAGIERIRAGLADADDGFTFVPRSRWPLDSVSTPLVGAGRRGAKA